MLKRYLLINDLKPECVHEYIQAHQTMHLGEWKEQLEVLKNAGASECIVYVHENLSILLYECEDIEESFAMLGKNPQRSAWDSYMAPMFAGQPKFDGSESIPTIKKVFDMKQQLNGILNDF